MRASEFITEVFTSNVSSEVVRATSDLYTTKATIGGRVIVFNASQYDDDEGKSIWEIDFTEYEKDGTGTTFRKTGSGGELQVFSFVIESIKDLIASYHPDQLTFTSHKADDNRTKLYQRMLNRIKVPGYHAAPIDSGEYDDYFKIVKDNLDEAEVATKNSNEIWRQLKAAGYQYVGSGADATVFAKDDTHVIKILMPEDMGTKAEEVFRKFYEFSMSHQDLACVPRFNEVNTIDINGKDYTQIEMERLAPIEKDSFVEGLIWFLSDYINTNTPWATVESELANPETWEIYSPNFANAFAKTWQSLTQNPAPASKKTYTMYRQLYNVMKLLYTTGTINKFGWDLHTANVMQRKDGQPVIIDPWFSEGTS
jgi:hypothetical protein